MLCGLLFCNFNYCLIHNASQFHIAFAGLFLFQTRFYFLPPYAEQSDKYEKDGKNCPQSAGVDCCREKISPNSAYASECGYKKGGLQFYILLADM